MPFTQRNSENPSLASRRTLLLGSGATLLAGCGGKKERRVTVRFWNGFTGPDGRTMLRMVQRFNASHPHIQIGRAHV